MSALIYVDLVFPSMANPQNEWEEILNGAKHCLIHLKCCGNARTNEDNLLYDVTKPDSDDPYVQGGVFNNGSSQLSVTLLIWKCIVAFCHTLP